jgi:hypothetical protein
MVSLNVWIMRKVLIRQKFSMFFGKHFMPSYFELQESLDVLKE